LEISRLPRRGKSLFPAQVYISLVDSLCPAPPQSTPPQQRLFKSLKLWSFYVDLEESIGTVESTKAVYDQIFSLKIANAQVFINAANFLEENQYWEESFKVKLHRSFARIVTS